MNGNINDLDHRQTEEETVTYEVSDEELEAALGTPTRGASNSFSCYLLLRLPHLIIIVAHVDPRTSLRSPGAVASATDRSSVRPEPQS